MFSWKSWFMYIIPIEQNNIEGAYRPLTIAPVEAGQRPFLESLFAPLFPNDRWEILFLVCFFREFRIKIRTYIFDVTILENVNIFDQVLDTLHAKDNISAY